MKWDGDRCTLSSGRQFTAHMGLLSVQDKGAVLYDGFDTTVNYGDPDCDEFTGGPLTAEERSEIAVHMISRWIRWASPTASLERS